MCTPKPDKSDDVERPASPAKGRSSCDPVAPRRCLVILVLVWLLVIGALVPAAFDGGAPTATDAPPGTIDPNRATWNELTVLPRIGEAKALAIVAYRDAYQAQSGRLAFRRPADLTAVKGIGPRTVERIAGELAFGE